MVMSTAGDGRGNGLASDPEVLGLVFLVGGALAVVSFVLFRVAISVGQELETPEPIQAIQRVLTPPREGRR